MEHNMNYVFYDIRTTGDQPHFDQILEIAAIQTDENFNGLARIRAGCRLMPHIAPSSVTLLASGITANQLFDRELPSFCNMVGQIEDAFSSWSPATFIHVNSRKLGEPMLRQALFQTLRNPFLMSSEGNHCLDALELAEAAILFAPGALRVLRAEDGAPSLAFQDLAAANGFDLSHNPDLLARVLVTIHLTRLIAQGAPKLWAFALEHADKASLAQFTECVPAFRWTQFCGGESVSSVVASLGFNPEVREEILVLDVATNDPPIFMTDAAMVSCLSANDALVRPIRLGDAGFITPIDMPPVSECAVDVNLGESLRYAQDLRTPAFAFLRRQVVRAYLRTPRPSPPISSPHVEDQLNDDVITRRERELCAAFHAAPWEARPRILSDLDDPRLQEFGRRLVAFERRDLMSRAELASHLEWLKQRLKGDVKVPWRTLPDAIAEIAESLGAEGLDDETADSLRGHLALCAARLGWRSWS
jgi:exodeoxyribonuclease I